jgi:hypothetical protein
MANLFDVLKNDIDLMRLMIDAVWMFFICVPKLWGGQVTTLCASFRFPLDVDKNTPVLYGQMKSNQKTLRDRSAVNLALSLQNCFRNTIPNRAAPIIIIDGEDLSPYCIMG